ncbi:Polygalacturonase At1g48100 [Linum perenne]
MASQSWKAFSRLQALPVLGPAILKLASNIMASACFNQHSDNGVQFKPWQGGYRSVSQGMYRNIRMESDRNPVIIDQYYCL